MSTSAFEITNGDRQRLSEILWGYRHGLLRVETLLEAQILFAAAGRDEQLGVTADLLEEAAAELARLDLLREVLLDTGSTGSGIAGAGPDRSISLREIAEASDETWSEILGDHHRWFEASVGRIRHLTEQSRHLQESTLQMITQAMGNVDRSTVTGYDRSGDAVRSGSGAVLFDERM